METRIVWITLLALCDRDGVARCSPLGLAHQARVEPKACEKALDVLMSPDADSRDGGDGVRVKRVDGGFCVVNYARVISEGARQERTEYMREKKREERARRAAKGGTVRVKDVGNDKLNEHAAAAYERSRWEECCCHKFRDLMNSGGEEPKVCPFCGKERPWKPTLIKLEDHD